jgi:hypothetical protein
VCDTRGSNAGWVPDTRARTDGEDGEGGGRWGEEVVLAALAGRPVMIYIGRAGAICIASVFTGRDEAMPAG